MVWAAFDRAVRAAEDFGLPGDVDRWREARDKIGAEDKTKIEAEIANVKAAIEKNDTAEIKAASDKLTEVSYDVFGRVYQQEAQAQQAAGANADAGFNGDAAGSAPHDDNVVDAEYEVVDDDKK